MSSVGWRYPGFLTIVVLAATGAACASGTPAPDSERDAGATASALLSEAANRVEDTLTQARVALGLEEPGEVVPPVAAEPTPAPATRKSRKPISAPKSVATVPNPELTSRQLPGLATTASVVHASVIHPNDERTYSPGDADVVPPVISDALLASLRTSGLPGTTNSLELLVASDGFVDGVRLMSPARQMSDMLVLGAAKTWQVEPARRDGHPVAYRVVLSWTSER